MAQQIGFTEIKQMLRSQAWERAKGELRSMLDTYYSETEDFTWAQDKIEEFITDMKEELGI
jgi:hypothetical protein